MRRGLHVQVGPKTPVHQSASISSIEILVEVLDLALPVAHGWLPLPLHCAVCNESGPPQQGQNRHRLVKTLQFENDLIPCTLVRRYKRFLADVEMPDGAVITVHCPNPGAMLGLDAPGSRAFISDSQNPARKLRHTLEIVEADGTLVGINTNLPNRLAREAIENGLVEVLPDAEIRAEQKYGENSRIDFLVHEPGLPPRFIEVKNVHLVRQPGLHEFPDCKTARGTKHLGELIRQVEAGNRATMLYIIQRQDGDRFTIAADLDPAYAEAFIMARRAGVEMLALKCHVTPQQIVAASPVEIADPAP